MDTIFLLSPARCDGRRAKILLNRDATFELATRIRSGGAPIGEVFSFLSGLYFRGKLAYARAFGRRKLGAPSHFVITTNCGLLAPDMTVTHDDLLAFADVDIAKAAGATSLRSRATSNDSRRTSRNRHASFSSPASRHANTSTRSPRRSASECCFRRNSSGAAT